MLMKVLKSPSFKCTRSLFCSPSLSSPSISPQVQSLCNTWAGRMVALSLKICVRQCNVVKTMQFEPSTAVYDACRVIRERVQEAQTGQGGTYFLCSLYSNSKIFLVANVVYFFQMQALIQCLLFLSFRIWAVSVRWRPQERHLAGRGPGAGLLHAEKWGKFFDPLSLSLYFTSCCQMFCDMSLDSCLVLVFATHFECVCVERWDEVLTMLLLVIFIVSVCVRGEMLPLVSTFTETSYSFVI